MSSKLTLNLPCTGCIQPRAVACHSLPAVHLSDWDLHPPVAAQALCHSVQSALPLCNSIRRPHQLSAQHRQQDCRQAGVPLHLCLLTTQLQHQPALKRLSVLLMGLLYSVPRKKPILSPESLVYKSMHSAKRPAALYGENLPIPCQYDRVGWSWHSRTRNRRAW